MLRRTRLRILSDPPGASLDDGIPAGQTPLTIDAGALRTVRLTMPGYHSELFPVRATGQAELRFTLTPVSAVPTTRVPASRYYPGAMLRSMLLPGWGQVSKGDPSGYWFGLGSFAAAGAYFYFDAAASNSLRRVSQIYQGEALRLTAYGLAGMQQTPTLSAAYWPAARQGALLYMAYGTPGIAETLARSCQPVTYLFTTGLSRSACRAHRNAERSKKAAAYSFGAIYAWNILDALLSDPRVPLAAAPMLGPDRGFLLAARANF